jgi:hypothetical protein
VIVSRDWYCRAFELEVTQEFHEDGRSAGVRPAHPITGIGIARLRELDIAYGPTLRGRVGLAVDVPDPDGIHVRLFTLATPDRSPE